MHCGLLLALDPDIVTPGPVGFFVTLLLALALILLGVNMSRRIRNLVHRASCAKSTTSSAGPSAKTDSA
ncbi:hypothetical protein [Tropheryma whipplei]|uniref:hypothetical protein n=1 Tax=Tropheryma whipplei TaxID=2039 RepID=UPI0004BC38CE|nr:hypothetical protein [Tropheryma whipplei]